MAKDYIILKSESDDKGSISINKSVIYSITELSIDEIEDARRIPKTRFNKPLTVSVEDNKLSIEADVKLKYQANVNQTCELIQNKIYENVYNMTGFKAGSVKVNVIGFDI